ncbi:MAG: hypothetical protein Q4C42_01335 [Clostridia bacterium]|nr:hypothetical protein [Clostridia bacterium]
MEKRFMQVFSLILAVSILLTSVPVSVFSEEAENADISEYESVGNEDSEIIDDFYDAGSEFIDEENESYEPEQSESASVSDSEEDVSEVQDEVSSEDTEGSSESSQENSQVPQEEITEIDNEVSEEESVSEPQQEETVSEEAVMEEATEEVSEDNQEFEEEFAELEADEEYITADSDMSSEEMFAGYVDSIFYSGPDVSFYGVSAREQLSENNKVLYDYLKLYCEDIANGTISSTQIEVPVSCFISDDRLSIHPSKNDGLLYYHFENNYFSVPAYDETTKKYNCTYTKEVDGITKTYYDTKYTAEMLQIDVSLVLKALLADNPYILYWYQKISVDNKGGVQYNLPIPSLGKENGLYLLNSKTVTFKFCVSEDFRGSDEYSVDVSKTSAAIEAKANADAIVSEATGSDYDKCLFYYNKIRKIQPSYNSGAQGGGQPYGNPWQMIWVFDNDPETMVVCEGFSKAFQYLCDNTVFEDDTYSLIATGHMNSISPESKDGPHMWNVLHMDDGFNYLVDVTNFRFLQVPVETDSATYYKFGNTYFIYDNVALDIYPFSMLELSMSQYHKAGQIITENVILPECTQNGSHDEVVLCSICGEEMSRTTVTDNATGHTEVTDEGEAPTFITGGLTEGSHCSVCGETIVAREEIPMLTKTDFSAADIELGYTSTTYTGTEKEPTVTVSVNGEIINSDAYKVVYSNNINAGSAKVTITAEEGNFPICGSAEISFTINKATPEVTAPTAKTLTYTGSVQKLINAGATTGGTLKYSLDGETYSGDIPGGTGAGTYRVYYMVDGGDNYKSTSYVDTPVIVTINPKFISAYTAILSTTSYTYNGSAKKPTVTVKNSSGAVLSSKNYKVTYVNNINAGSSSSANKPTVIITGDGNYSGTIKKYFTIKKANPLVTAPTAKLLIYSGSAQALANAGKTTGGSLRYSLDNSSYYSYVPGRTNVGAYKLWYKVIGNSNYNSTEAKSITVKINPKKAVISSYSNLNSGIKISWGKVTGATGYIIYRDGLKIAATTSLTYTDKSDTVRNAANGKYFKYTVKAYHKTSSGIYCYAAVSSSKTAYRVKKPSVFSVTAGTGYIKLNFSRIPSGMGYCIYRATGRTGTYSKIKTVTEGSSYKNSGLGSGRTYYYKIRAYKTINGKNVFSDYTAVAYTTVR